MYKIFLTIIITVCFSFVSYAEENAAAPQGTDEMNTEFAPNDEAYNPDEAGAAMPNIGISEEKPIVEVVEGVGHIPYNRMPFRAGPSLKSKVLRYSSGAEKVILIGETDDWYKVIMYNNQEAYIQKRYVRTTKVFMDETVTKNKMNKTVSIALDDLLAKFDETIENSNYAKKHQARPVFNMVDARNVRNIVTLTFHYACADLNGRPIPSYNENTLYEYMQKLVDLILGRLVLSNAEQFNIIIKIPDFDENGNVIDFDKEYANIVLTPDKVNIDKIHKENISILSLAECNIPVKDLFKVFPK
ncbi:MAG TPA: SH3 domain-containing protein [Candidatus Mucispirillum faecigallinarum]|uniref:SH3 domain-containing protein n=1 Tax=Candidatus Mucispirillum faecigallinarum TaxID=2838699 RepID=A0A9D2GUS8_9BACT|nr:SH3 domain-containing protein [Candidatus Mucispirillum faecigallinarum]